MSIADIKDKAEEFDYNQALSFCADDEDFLAEMLGDYANSGDGETLEGFYAEKDWKNYEIKVHSLKSTSRLVGFPVLGDLCEELQKAAGNADADFITGHHAEMMERYNKNIQAILDALN